MLPLLQRIILSQLFIFFKTFEISRSCLFKRHSPQGDGLGCHRPGRIDAEFVLLYACDLTHSPLYDVQGEMAEVGAELIAPISALPGVGMGEDCLGLPWDPLREQDWESLSSDATLPWEISSHDGCGMDMDSCPRSDHEQVRMQHKACIQFSPVAIDTMADCFWDNTGLSIPNSVKKQIVTGPFDDVIRSQQYAKYHQSMPHCDEAAHSIHAHAEHHEDDAASEEKFEHHEHSDHESQHQPPQPDQHHTETAHEPDQRQRAASARIRAPLRLKIPASNASMPAANGLTTPTGEANETAIFVVHLFVTAIADGKILPDTSEKMLGVLEQVRRRSVFLIFVLDYAT